MHQPFRCGQHHQKIVETHDAVDRRRKLINFLAQVSCEQGARHHVESQMHHVGGDIALFTRTPRITDARRLFHHDAGIFANALPVEGRLRGQSLGAVHRPFTSDHAFAKQHPGALHRAFLDEVVVLHYQHLPDVLRMVQKNNVVRTDLVVCDIAIGLGQVLKEKDGICWTKFAERKP